MGDIVVLGERHRVAGFALAGARTVVAEHPDDVRLAWQALGAETAVVIVTPTAAQALHGQLGLPPDPGQPLLVVMPEVPPPAREVPRERT